MSSFPLLLQNFYRAENKRHRKARVCALQAPTHLSAASAIKLYLATDKGQASPLKPLMLCYLASAQTSVDDERCFAVVNSIS